MRFLKNKILKAKEAMRQRQFEERGRLKGCPVFKIMLNAKKEDPEEIYLPEESKEAKKLVLSVEKLEELSWIDHSQPKKRIKVEDISQRKPIPETKNIPINYGKAIASFAVSPLALPYLKSYLKGKALSVKEFVDLINESKEGIRGIDTFRAMLLIEKKDNLKIVLCKKAFQWISEVFIKCFSVNWIIHGRMAHKMTYLKYRHKMLRRIKQPEYFTYVRRGVEKTEE